MPVGGAVFSSSFSFIWFHMFHWAIYSFFWFCVTSIFIFKPLGPGADTSWPLLKCLLHSERISLQQSWWHRTIYLISKLFFDTFGDLQLFRNANYWTRVIDPKDMCSTDHTRSCLYTLSRSPSGFSKFLEQLTFHPSLSLSTTWWRQHDTIMNIISWPTTIERLEGGLMHFNEGPEMGWKVLTAW